MFLVALVCLSASGQHYSKSYEEIAMKFKHFYMYIRSLQYLMENSEVEHHVSTFLLSILPEIRRIMRTVFLACCAGVA